MKCIECGSEMDGIMLLDFFGRPLYVAEYECPNCNMFYDRNGDWKECEE